MSTTFFPLPTSMFNAEVAKACSAAFAQAVASLKPSDAVLAPEFERLALANGIVIAASLGLRDSEALAKAALDHLALVRSWALPALEPVKNEAAKQGHAPERYLLRVEELRAAADGLKVPQYREALLAISLDYERMAATATRIQASRAAIERSVAGGRSN